jgi:L-ascorbate metabolism protein UlaG (beta-lactamase superfamily)
MVPTLIAVLSALVLAAFPAFSQEGFRKDTIKTSAGNLEITFIGHGSLMMSFGGKTVYVDPWSRLADYATLPKADLILITHEHGDHMDPKALDQVRNAKTIILLTQKCADQVKGGTVMKNGDVRTELGIGVEAVPAYNLEHKRPDGRPFHPKGEGNGYVLTFAGTRVYVAGDTENTPEMKALKGIDIAFLPMNLPYTMTPQMAADAALAFRPHVLYPYHYGETDPGILAGLLKDAKDIEVRIRSMK